MITKDSLPIDSVDIVITHWSSLAFESMILGVLTILVNPGGEFDFAKRYFEDYEFIIEDVHSINVLVTISTTKESVTFSVTGDTVKGSITFKNTNKNI